MKTSFFSFAIFVLASLFASNAAAQTDNQATFEAYLKTVYGAFETGGFDALAKYYASSASEISPDGTQLNGLAAIRANWAEAEKMFDAKPQFEYELTSHRMVTPNLALINWDATDKFSIQGQKMEFHSTASALLRKEKGQWLIEFSQLTPKMPFQMPDQQADIAAIEATTKEAYAAFEARDAKRFAACFTADAQQVDPHGGVHNGNSAIQQAHAELFKNFPPYTVELSKINTRFISPDVAVSTWSDKVTAEMGGKKMTEERSFINMVQRVEGKWLSTALSITPKREMPGVAGH